MLELAVVGAGIMGANHARVSASLRDARVSVIVDPDEERGRVLAEAVGATWVPDVADAVGRVEGAIVAVPNERHEEIATQLMRAGVGVLVEKPLAPTSEAARRIVDVAALSEVVLAVGHVERFNPAVLELDRLLGEIVHVSAARISAFSPRIRDGVVLDLMIHDLDIVRAVAGGEVESVSSVLSYPRSDTEDLAAALLTFDNAVTADLTASRVGQNKIRQLQITQRESFVIVDLVRQDVTVHRVDHSEFLSSEGARYRQTGVVEIPYLENRGEPLLLQLEHFVRCLKGEQRPRVGGQDGLAAVALAEQVRAAAPARRQ